MGIFLQFYFDSFELPFQVAQKSSLQKSANVIVILLFTLVITLAFVECYCELERLLEVNWAQRWMKTVNFAYIPLGEKC